MTVKSESGCPRERPQSSAFFFIDMLFPLRGKANGIREIFADLEAKLHESVCRETVNTERRSGKDLMKSDLIS